MDKSEILEQIKSNLSLGYYELDNFVFYVGKNKSLAMAMKALIQITTKLEEENLDYRIDHEYNIHVIQE